MKACGSQADLHDEWTHENLEQLPSVYLEHVKEDLETA